MQPIFHMVNAGCFYSSINHFFQLYGENQISQDCLPLTDDDHTEYGPLYNYIATNGVLWDDISHVVCFCAMVMAFHESAYPKVSHKKGSKCK